MRFYGKGRKRRGQSWERRRNEKNTFAKLQDLFSDCNHGHFSDFASPCASVFPSVYFRSGSCFTFGASDSTWKKSISFFEKRSAFCFSDFASVFAFGYFALSIDFTRASFCDEENVRLSRLSSFDKRNESGNSGNFAELPSGKFSGRIFGSAE